MSEEATVEAGEEVTTEQAGETVETVTESAEASTGLDRLEGEQVGVEADGANDDWRASIADEKLRQFADQFTSPADAAKTAFEFRQKLSNAVALPGKNATDDDIKEFRSKLGVPETPEGYNISLPDDIDDTLKSGIESVVDRLHKAGATPDVVNAAVEMHISDYAEYQESQAKQSEESRKAAEEALQKEWGGDYEKNVTFAVRGAQQFGGDEFKEFLDKAEIDGTKLGDHPQFLKVFAQIGRRMSEGGLESTMSEDDKQSVESQMDELTGKIHQAMSSGNRSEANKLSAQRDKLAQEFYGTQ